MLRHQLAVLRRQTPRPRLEPADQALLAAVSCVQPPARWSWFLVTPRTLLRWHRRLLADDEVITLTDREAEHAVIGLFRPASEHGGSDDA